MEGDRPDLWRVHFLIADLSTRNLTTITPNHHIPLEIELQPICRVHGVQFAKLNIELGSSSPQRLTTGP